MCESIRKLKMLSMVVDANDADATMYLQVPQVIDSKRAKWVMSPSESGMSCQTCIYYHLAVELKENERVPPEDRHDYDERDLIEMVKLPIYFGYCSKLLPKWGVLISGIRSDEMCGFFEEKPSYLQFDDDVIEQDDGRTPIVPSLLGGF